MHFKSRPHVNHIWIKCLSFLDVLIQPSVRTTFIHFKSTYSLLYIGMFFFKMSSITKLVKAFEKYSETFYLNCRLSCFYFPVACVLRSRLLSLESNHILTFCYLLYLCSHFSFLVNLSYWNATTSVHLPPSS